MSPTNVQRQHLDWFAIAPAEDVVMAFVEDGSLLLDVQRQLRRREADMRDALEACLRYFEKRADQDADGRPDACAYLRGLVIDALGDQP